jgi:hypothetical protein
MTRRIQSLQIANRGPIVIHVTRAVSRSGCVGGLQSGSGAPPRVVG